MAQQRRRPQARPGDLTGQTKAAQQKEHAAEIAEAARGMSLINGPQVEPSDEIVDYSDGGSTTAGLGNEGVRTIDVSELGADTHVDEIDLPDDEVDMTALPDGTYDVRPEMVKRLDEPLPAHDRGPQKVKDVIRTGDGAAPVATKQFRVMRVNTDLEDVTIGKDQHFTFREGTRYRVPADVYDHLDEKGYVYH